MDRDMDKKDIVANYDRSKLSSSPDDDFRYDPSAPIKAAYTEVRDHTVWLEFCRLAEDLKTTPTLLTFILQEKLLLTLGRLKPDYRLTNPVNMTEPVNVFIADLEDTEKYFGLGQNRLVADSKKPRENATDNDEFEDDPYRTGL